MTGEGDRSLFEGGGGGLRGLSAGDTAGGVHGEDDAASLGDLRGLSATKSIQERLKWLLD